MIEHREAIHRDPVWRDRSNFIIATKIDPGATEIAIEQLWARRLDDFRFEICCIPFFAYNLALGDVVEVDSEYLVRRTVTPSGRFVFRVHFDRPKLPFRDEIVLELQALGALLEWSSPSLLAVDAQDEHHGQEIADYLLEQETRGRLVYETGRVA